MTESVLRYFADFLPLAARVAPIDRTIEQIHAAHDTNTGVDPAALGEDAAVLRHVLIEAQAQWQEQARMARALPDYWRGDAATRAQEAMLGNIGRAEGALTGMREAVEGLEAAQTTLADVARGRADAIGCFPAAIDGQSVQAIVSMVDRAIEPGDADCQAWLDGVFLPHVRESLAVFDDICAAADKSVETTMGVLDRTLAQVDEHAAGLAVAALAGVGGIAIAAGELALTVGAELVDEFAFHAAPGESEPATEPEAERWQWKQDGTREPSATSEPPRDSALDDGQAATAPPSGPQARNEPAIALEQPEPDAAQQDSIEREREPLLASAGDEPAADEPRRPEVQLGEAGPL